MIKSMCRGAYIAFMVTLALFLLVLLPIKLFAPHFESKYFPVVELTQQPYFGKMEGGKDYAILRYRTLRSCKPVEGVFGWYVKKNNEYIRVGAEGSLNSDINNNIRFSKIVSYSSLTNDAEKQYIRVLYDCHPFWPTPTLISLKGDGNV